MGYHQHLPVGAHPLESIEDALLDSHLRDLILRLVDDVDPCFRIVFCQQIEIQTPVQARRRFGVDAYSPVGNFPSLGNTINLHLEPILDIAIARCYSGLVTLHHAHNITCGQIGFMLDTAQ